MDNNTVFISFLGLIFLVTLYEMKIHHYVYAKEYAIPIGVILLGTT
jgi:hypothetical protein